MSAQVQETPARWPALMTEEEASAYLSVSTVTLFRLRRARLLPYLRVGRCVRYRKASLDAWIAREERGGERAELETRRRARPMEVRS